ncbi:hypothetical protein LQZ18_05675 [Lachnospiraceae bacterium ZAX-1]
MAICLMVSGFLLSPLSDFFNVRSGLFGRRLHMLSASWGLTLMSAHLGLHWGMFVGMWKKVVKIKAPAFLTPLIAVAIAIYGAYAFVIRQIGLKMFLRIDFAFFDFAESAVNFFIDYLAIIGLFVCIGYYVMKLVAKKMEGLQNEKDSSTTRI